MDPKPGPACRVCTTCGLEKPVVEFAFVPARQRLHVYCRTCKSAYNRKHYLDNKAQYIRNVMRKKGERLTVNRRLVWDYLVQHPCVDCHEADPIVLEFDHRDPQHKTAAVSQMVSDYSWERIQLEIAKCDVRCANCHRRRTARQFGWAVLSFEPHAHVAQSDRATLS